MIITFDGTSGSGKGTIAAKVADHYQAAYLDTGKLYRAFAFLVLKHDMLDNFVKKSGELVSMINQDILSLDELYSEEIAKIASKIAKEKSVRQSLISMQRNFAKSHQNVVLDGRDTGSVICPEADHKFYIDADVTIRARRRFEQLIQKGIQNRSLESITDDLKQRDFNDKNRSEAPLIIPEGANVIDNSYGSVDIVVKKVLELIDK
ncbi:MAG: (d)CMP kinase [Rickettsiales bacterium]|nr:(d)CMP kinase [Rickettsiales bacterium]